MAKIREALRRVETSREPVQETVVGLRPYQPEDVPCPLEGDVEIPFIEVGGRATPIEASASVLASVPKTIAWQPSAGSVGKDSLAQRGETTLPAAEARLGGIAFRPFPLEAPPLRPAADRFAPELVALHQPDHPLSKQYRGLIQSLEKGMPAGQSRALLFLAPLPEVDTSTVLLNLAITCATSGTVRTLAVDANLYGPILAERLGLPAAPGLGEVLAGKQTVARAIQETGQPNLFALTAGKTTPERTALVAGEPMRAVLRQLRARFNWIFVNAPCWDGRPERIAFGSACDAVYLVLPEEEAETEAVEELSQLLVQQGSCLRGYFLI
jgi:Mrp family chromosome partitioning ATPase